MAQLLLSAVSASASTIDSIASPREPLTSTMSPGWIRPEQHGDRVVVVRCRMDVGGLHAGGERLFGDPARSAAHRHQLGCHLGRPPADQTVPFFLVGSELQHLAQHDDRPVGIVDDLLQQIERCQHRHRAGIVRVVDDHRPAQTRHHHQPQLAALLLQPRQDLGPTQALHQAGCGCAQRRVDAVPAQHRQVHVQDLFAVVEAEANALKSFAADLVGPQIAGLVEPVGEHAGRRAARHGAHQRIVGVQDRDAPRISRGQRLHQLGFGLRDPLDGTQAFQVRRARRW